MSDEKHRGFRILTKDQWGDGPWQHEPDRDEWRDADTGLPCLIVRAMHTGALCGYVGIDETHPLHRCYFTRYFPDDIDAPEYMDGLSWRAKHPLVDVERTRANMEAIHDLEVHGGLTYADGCFGHICHTPQAGESHDTWWFGFDCGHCWDVMPGLAARLKSLGADDHDDPLARYRSIQYVRRECAKLAEQLHDLRAPA